MMTDHLLSAGLAGATLRPFGRRRLTGTAAFAFLYLKAADPITT
jgi:hypothetical protein